MIMAVAIWLIGGIIVGGLANGARLSLPARRPSLPHGGWLSLGLGALAALAGGLLGTWLFGGLYALPTALWLAVAVTVAVPWLMRERAGPVAGGHTNRESDTARDRSLIGGSRGRDSGADGSGSPLGDGASDATLGIAGDGDARAGL